MIDIKSIDRRLLIFWATNLFATLICVGMFVWAICYLHLHARVSLAAWVFIYIAIVAYICATIWALLRNWGLRRLLAHTVLVQIVPICSAITIFCLAPSTTSSTTPTATATRSVKAKRDNYTPIKGTARTYERSFNDLQPKQKRAALANGLAPFKSRAQVEEQYSKLRRKGKLVHISTNSKYVVKHLTHSSPYVVPKVEQLLEDIADAFQEVTQSKSRFIVTSVLRTEEDVRKLSRVNGNVSTASCHCNATTIDISYVRFEEDKARPRSTYELRIALAKVLHDLRKAGRCYVKIERKQYCYHITVR